MAAGWGAAKDRSRGFLFLSIKVCINKEREGARRGRSAARDRASLLGPWVRSKPAFPHRKAPLRRRGRERASEGRRGESGCVGLCRLALPPGCGHQALSSSRPALPRSIPHLCSLAAPAGSLAPRALWRRRASIGFAFAKSGVHRAFGEDPAGGSTAKMPVP